MKIAVPEPTFVGEWPPPPAPPVAMKMLRTVARHCSGEFARAGEVMPAIHAFDYATRSLTIIVMPWRDPFEKKVITIAAGLRLQKMRCRTFVFVSESWAMATDAVPGESLEESRARLPKGSWEHAPGRREILLYLIHANGHWYHAQQAIVRPEDRPHYLADDVQRMDWAPRGGDLFDDLGVLP